MKSENYLKELNMSDARLSTFVGSSGSGKTSFGIIPLVRSIIDRKESCVVLDPKCELISFLGKNLQESGYKIIQIDLRDPAISDRWNPLMQPYQLFKQGNHNAANDLLIDMANVLYSSYDHSTDPFWDISAKSLFLGLANLLFSNAKSEEEINLKSLMYMGVKGAESFGASNYLTEYCKMYAREASEMGEFDQATLNIMGVMNSPKDTQMSILSTYFQRLRYFSMGDNLDYLLAASSFDLEDIFSNERVILILRYADEKRDTSQLSSMLIESLFTQLVNMRTLENDAEHAPFTFVLEDFLSLSRLVDVEKMIACSKSRNIRLALAINNRNLFEKKYQGFGADLFKFLIANSDMSICFDDNNRFPEDDISYDYRSVKYDAEKGTKIFQRNKGGDTVQDVILLEAKKIFKETQTTLACDVQIESGNFSVPIFHFDRELEDMKKRQTYDMLESSKDDNFSQVLPMSSTIDQTFLFDLNDKIDKIEVANSEQESNPTVFVNELD